jgi:hypothetical protein
MGFESGQYGSPPSLLFWSRQAAVYVIALLSMKVVVVILIGSWDGMFTIGEWLLSWTEGPVQVILYEALLPVDGNSSLTLMQRHGPVSHRHEHYLILGD